MRKKKVLIISAVATAFAVAIGFSIQGHNRAAQYKLLTENSYTHAYYELSTAVSELDAVLQKAQYATTPVMLGIFCTDIYGKAVAAQMALGELPSSDITLEQTSAFLARTGDYACALSKTVAVDHGCNDEARAILQTLAKTSSALSSSLLDLQTDLAGGTVSIGSLILAEESLARQTGNSRAPQGGTAFQTMESDFPETPTLIYDGPFSEHLSNKTPLALDGLSSVNQKEAQAVAAHFLGLPSEKLTQAGQGDGVLPTWGFSATVGEDDFYVEVTRQGGQVLSLVSSHPTGDITLSAQDALVVARNFLIARGFSSMEESYHINQGNTLTINFAPRVQDVLCYPDLVKVSVALDSGSVTGFECHGWIMNHTTRDFTTPAIDTSTAAAVVSPDLEILSHQLALIPTGGEYEVLCHEFKCRTEQDSHVIVYINAQTGNEEKILLLLEDDSGVLVR